MLNNFLLWILVFVLPMHLSYLILSKLRINYVQRNILSGCLFALISVAIFFIQREIITKYSNVSIISIFTLVAIMSLAISLVDFFKKQLPIKNEIKNSPSAPYFFNFSLPFLFTKLNDIVFQQIMIILLINLLLELNLSISTVIVIFVLIFSLIHLPTLKNHGSLGFYYFGMALFGSFVFPLLLLKISGSFLYNISLHLFSYILGRAAFGYYYSRQRIV